MRELNRRAFLTSNGHAETKQLRARRESLESEPPA